MVKLRLQRHGTKKRPFYRIVATDVRNPRDGRFLELLGHFDSIGYKNKVTLKEDRIRYWLSKGAQPTRTLGSILKKEKFVMEAKSD